MTGARFRTNCRLWAITTACLLVALGLVNPLAGSGVEIDESLWHQAVTLARGEYICSTGDLLLHVLFLAGVLSVPAVLFGWLLQAAAVIVREKKQGLQLSTGPRCG